MSKPIHPLVCLACKARFLVQAYRKDDAKFCSRKCFATGARLGLCAKPKSTSKYLRTWTAEEEQIVRERYAIDGPEVVAKRLFRRSPEAIKMRAQKLGVAVKLRRNWTKEDDAWLTEHSSRPYAELSRKLNRSREAIKERLYRLSVMRTNDNFYTANATALIFGVDAHAVLRWISKGLLRAMKVEDIKGDLFAYQISDKAIRDFVRQHPAAFNIRKVDQISFLDIVLGTQGSQWAARKEAQS